MLTVNSKDRVSGTSGNFLIKNMRFRKVTSFKIDYISLPYSWYNINSNNNQIMINGSTVVTITSGQYNATSLASALQTALQAVDATFTVTYSTITGMYTIARSTVFVLNLSSASFTMRRQLGFNAKSDTASAISQTSDSYANLQNSNSISLHCELLAKFLDDIITDFRTDYLLSIPIDQNPGNLIVYRPAVDTIYNLREPIYADEMTFSLRDIDQNIISLNGCEWEMKLVFF